MEVMRSEGELSSGYKLVPWSSWDQWNFVRESIFSSSSDSVAAALRRISAWRSRGCLPIAIDVTAAIIDIRQKDPFFREGPTEDALSSEEMLAMLYCMSIMRLVNGLVEHAHKKTGRSISELADAVGIPRMLVDIRHESSHRDLPSLPLVRLASMKALDWLKAHYWEPQRNAIPNVRKEIRTRLREMTYHIKSKHAQRLSTSQIKGKRMKRSGLLRACNKLSSQITGRPRSSKSDGSEKQISKISKVVARLYSAYPSEVVSVLLEFFQLQASDFSDEIDAESSDRSDNGDPEPPVGSINDFKAIITRLSSKKPGLLLGILKTVLEMIEVKELMKYEKGEYHFLTSQYQADISQIEHLSSLVPWLLKNFKKIKDSGQIGLIVETQATSTGNIDAPKVPLTKLLRKCLNLSDLSNKHLLDSILLLAEMIGNSSLTERLKKLPVLSSQNQGFTGEDSTYSESMLLQEEDSVTKAAEKLDFLKLHLTNRCNKSTPPDEGNSETRGNLWTVAKSWIPCPIGMLPCSFSSTAVLPVLDKEVHNGVESKLLEVKHDKAEMVHANGKREASCGIELLEDASASKRSRHTSKEHGLDTAKVTSPMEGRLLIDGVWKKVGQDELLAIESNIRIMVQ